MKYTRMRNIVKITLDENKDKDLTVIFKGKQAFTHYTAYVEALHRHSIGYQVYTKFGINPFWRKLYTIVDLEKIEKEKRDNV